MPFSCGGLDSSGSVLKPKYTFSVFIIYWGFAIRHYADFIKSTRKRIGVFHLARTANLSAAKSTSVRSLRHSLPRNLKETVSGWQSRVLEGLAKLELRSKPPSGLVTSIPIARCSGSQLSMFQASMRVFSRLVGNSKYLASMRTRQTSNRS